MEIDYRCGCSRIGTGAMVCSNGLITAGHNLVCESHNLGLDSIVFYFGYEGRGNYYYKYSDSIKYWYYDDFANGYSSKNDIGYVRFNQNVGDTTGWFATRYAGDSEFKGKACKVGAYSSRGGLTIYSATLSVANKSQFSFNLSELPYGGEGGPIYILRGSDQTPTIVGVYTSHNSERCLGRRLTKSIFDDMVSDLNFTSVTRD